MPRLFTLAALSAFLLAACAPPDMSQARLNAIAICDKAAQKPASGWDSGQDGLRDSDYAYANCMRQQGQDP